MEVIISKSVRKGRKKVYHTKKCIHTGRISEDNKVVTSESNAKKLGYTQCKCCSGLAGMLLENRSNIKRWKEKDGLRFNAPRVSGRYMLACIIEEFEKEFEQNGH